MREQAERNAVGLQQRDSLFIPQQRRGVPGVHVKQRPDGLVITGDKGRRVPHSFSRFHDAAVERDAERAHRLRLVDAAIAEQLACFFVKSLLRGGSDVERLLAPARDIHHHQHQVLLHRLEIEKVAAEARCTVERGHVGPFQAGHIRGRRFPQRAFRCSMEKRQFHGKRGQGESESIIVPPECKGAKKSAAAPGLPRLPRVL
jgi:hypothetical protein